MACTMHGFRGHVDISGAFELREALKCLSCVWNPNTRHEGSIDGTRPSAHISLHSSIAKVWEASRH